ncbi:hypothetical protein AAF712_011274 [Marasmius tenuissimus]|uniref:JmjC domain-containing protein n=1 Tax=Marasmius tenuissimus TaxID=585030 RepID=A0ABR2ZKJ3_9AGAR
MTSQTLQTNLTDCGPFVIGNLVLHAHSGGELNHLLTQDRIPIVRAAVLSKILGEDENSHSESNPAKISSPGRDLPSVSSGALAPSVLSPISAEEASLSQANALPFINLPSTQTSNTVVASTDQSLITNTSLDIEMEQSAFSMCASVPTTPSTPYDADFGFDSEPGRCTNQIATWSPSVSLVDLNHIMDADPLSSASLGDVHLQSPNSAQFPHGTDSPIMCLDNVTDPVSNCIPITIEGLPCNDMDMDVQTLVVDQAPTGSGHDGSNTAALPTELEGGTELKDELASGISLDDVVVNAPDTGEPILRQSTRDRKPVDYYTDGSVPVLNISKPKTRVKTPGAKSTPETHVSRSDSFDRKESKYHTNYLATLQRADFKPALQHPRMGGKVYYITSYGNQSYFYKAFMLRTKDQDLLDDLFDASGSLRSVPDRFAKYPANDSVLSKPLTPNPAEAGPPNKFKNRCIATFTFNTYQEKSVVELQRTFRTHPIVISDVPKIRGNSKWDETSMARIGCLKTLRQAHDASIVPQKDPNEAIIKASLSIALSEAVNVNSGKPLNFIDLPGDGEFLFPGDMSSDVLATKHTLFDLSLYNSSSSSTSWHIVSTKDAFSPIHMDAQGTATMLMVEVGAKLVFMFVPRSGDQSILSKLLYSLDVAMATDKVSVRKLAQQLDCEVQGVLLMPGDVLLMPPATYHVVFTLEPTICNGRHFFSSSTIRQTCWALFHTLILGHAITNEDHTISRGVLVRLLGFWHQLFTGNNWSSVNEDIGHTPDWSTMAGVADFLAIACVVELGPTLWQESYSGDKLPEKDVHELARARDWSREIFESYTTAHSLHLRDKTQGLVMRSRDRGSTSMWSDLRCSYFVQMMCCLIEHADRSESDMDVLEVMEEHLPSQGDLGKSLWQRFEKTMDSDTSGTLFPSVKDHWSSYEWFYITDAVNNPYMLHVVPP